MSISKAMAAAMAVAVVGVGLAGPVEAIPSFARKYGTSCVTCHTVFPKLTPFGEAFRRNGYRFPGVDSDYVKQDTVALGQEVNKKTFPESIWPSSIPISSPLSLGFNGQVMTYPDTNATVPRTTNKQMVSLDNLAGSGHLWGGAALSDTVTVFAQITLGDGQPVSIEQAQILFNDLVGPAHWVNLVVGKGVPTLTSFGPHSSYAGDMAMPALPVTAIYGVSDLSGAVTPLSTGFYPEDNYNSLEANGVVLHRINYSVGLASSNSASGFNAENYYGSLGFKLGGMRLDGEGDTGPQDSMKPWAENAVTVHGFMFHGNEHFADVNGSGTNIDNASLTLGAGLRAQWGSAELDFGYYNQSNTRGGTYWDSSASAYAYNQVRADTEYGEFSYVVFPWFVPVLRVENVGLQPSGGARVSDLHMMPAIAFAIRPNLKVTVAGNLEFTNGFPTVFNSNGTAVPVAWQGGGQSNGPISIGPNSTAVGSSSQREFESLSFFLDWAL